MEVQQQLTYELRNRVGLLPGVINELKDLAAKDSNGMGIHQSQIETVKALLDKMQLEKDPLINQLSADLPRDEFAARREEIEQFLTVVNSIMATFRYVFAQRDDSPADKAILDIADLVAAFCYKPYMELANRWRGLPKDHYREPPLIYLNAMLSPAAISRRHDLRQVGLKLYTDTENNLPISMISIPFHDTIAIWTLCSLYHEVGHLFDNDLNLRDELSTALTAALKNSGEQNSEAATRRTVWNSWIAEMLADAFGVLLGGAAYGYSLLGMIFRSAVDVTTVSGDNHPNEHVRAHLLAALLRATGVPGLAEAAQKITLTWQAAYGEIVELQPYVKECDVVADVLLKTKLDVLRDQQKQDSQPHALVEFGYKLAADHSKIESLASWLRSGTDRPDPDNYNYQLIPAAAQLAVEGVTEDFENNYPAIQRATLDFISEIYRAKFLNPNPNTQSRQDYLNKLIGEQKFFRV